MLGDIVYINDETHSKFVSTEILPGDVLLNITGASIGRCAVVDSCIVGGNVNQHVCIIRCEDKKVIPEYLMHTLISKSGQRQIDEFQAGGNRQGLNFQQVKSIQIAKPVSIDEQKEICRKIQGIDSFVTSLEKLIEKKKLIKQGVMQELLTGKRRLPGFSREWETKRLGDLFSLQYGKPMKESDRVESGVIPVYGSNGVVGYTFTELTSCPTIIVGRKGAAGSVHHSPTGCWPIDTTFYIEFDDYTESLFYYYLLQCAGLDRIKSDSAVPGLNRADAYALMITVPSKEERIQIAEILLSIDQEITYLTNSLDKHKLLKQAMMQELLTGRIRLI
jgi:type I restriction enzyme S subunit